MINYLKGEIISVSNHTVTLMVHGFGFAIGVPDERVYSKGDTVELSIYFHWNNENGPSLYGFNSDSGKIIFSLILSVSGLGPKIGLALLSAMKPEQFAQAITLADVKALSSINGIGPKKAELLIMQLRDKISKINTIDLTASKEGSFIKVKELSDALNSLNYSRIEVNAALEYVRNNAQLQEATFDVLLRKALSFLSVRG